jgi:hypothetical protein
MGWGSLVLALFHAPGLRCPRRTGVALSSLRLDPHPAVLRVFVHSDDEARVGAVMTALAVLFAPLWLGGPTLENIVRIIRHSHP